jgi:signal transduction histidine kinase/ligand-binding sensor domain-containing protein
MQDLLVDPDGSLWVASLGGGIAHYRAGKFSSYTSRDGLPSDDIQSLFRDSKGTLWVGTREGGIARMVEGKFEKLSLTVPASPITAFLENPDQSLWIATSGSGVFLLKDDALVSFSVKDGLPDDRVTALYRDHSGKVWTAGWKGISFWNGSRFVGHAAVNRVVNYAISAMEDRDGNLWIASSSGLFRENEGRVTKLDRSSGLSGDFVSDVFEDRERNVWVATRAGLDRLQDGQVRTFTGQEGLFRDPGPLVTDGGGGVWTVSDKQMARIAANEVSVWPISLPTGSIPLTMVSGPDSGFLIGFDKGVNHWSREHTGSMPELAGLDVLSMLQASDGSIWIGTGSRGLLRWKSSVGSATLVETGVSDMAITTLAEDQTGVVWAGSKSGGGIYRLDGGSVQHFGRNEGLRSPLVYSMFMDGRDDLWIGSVGGLSWFHEGKLRTVNSQQGLPSDQIFAIVDDAYDRLWFTGYGGIAAIEKKSLTEWAAGKRQKLNPTVYRTADGLQINTVSRNFPNAARTADGHLWFSIADGLTEVTPFKPRALAGPEFPVLIEDVIIDRVSYSAPGQIRIPAGARSIELRYTALTLSHPETVRFRYRLEGADGDWIDADTRRVAFYNNLKPGNYSFRVSASFGEEQWQESSAMILEQLPYFYQTSWFLLLGGATVLSLAFFAYRLRLQQAVDRIQAGFQERMDERTRIAQELHDTVVQAISGSTMLVENAAEKVPDSMPVVKGALLRAVDKLDVALAESRAALKGLRSSASSENNLASQLSDVANDAQTPGIAFKLVITGEPRPIRPMIQYEVFRIASEAIGNAFKHSGAQSIRVELDYLNGLRVSVRDDGTGIPEQVRLQGKDGHFGLAGMRERVESIGGALEVASRVREGTEVDLIVPDEIAFEDSGRNLSPLGRVLSRFMTVGRRNL